jgi:hypothetical protein
MIRLKLFIILFINCITVVAQEAPVKKPELHYYRKEEIIYDGKRYRIHNSYVTVGGGFMQSSIRQGSQKTLGVDFQLPVRKLHFQLGGMVSGYGFGSDNNRQLHVGWGYRRERTGDNLAVYAGPSYYWGVRGDTSTGPINYQGMGAYVCVQAIKKLVFDIGIGIEGFAEFSKTQRLFGFRIIAFFSGAYQGVRKNYNKHVRAENPNLK